MQQGISSQLSRVAGWTWVRDLRQAPASRLHARRRRAAQVELERLKPRSILFVCHGNICRSPFAAAAFLRSCAPEIARGINVTSAGFIGPKRSPPSAALTAASRFGVDLSAHRSALITSENLRAADLIVVMSQQQARGIRARVPPSTFVLMLGDLDPRPVNHRTILDPWGQPDGAFDESYDRIDRCVRELARIISAAH
jgi:protein-tyrosine-phosphatase